MYLSQILEELFSRLWKVLRFFLLLGLAFIILYPLIYMLSISFRSMSDFHDPSIVWVPKTLSLENYADVFKVMDYPKALLNTFLIGGVSSAIQMASCVTIAYGFARFQFKLKKLLSALVLITIVLPPQITAVPLFVLMKEFSIPFVGIFLKDLTDVSLSVNLIDTPLAFYLQALLGVGIRSGIYIFMLRQFFRGIPAELEEAAFIDGCGPVRTFIRIVIPNSVTMMITVFLFSLVWYWNDFFSTSLFVSHRKTLAVSLALLRGDLAKIVGLNNVLEGTTRMQAGCFVVIVPLLIIYIFLQRYYVEGVERSGLVG